MIFQFIVLFMLFYLFLFYSFIIFEHQGTMTWLLLNIASSSGLSPSHKPVTGARKKIHVFIYSLLLKLFVLNSRGNKKKKPKQKYYSKKTDSPNGIWIQPFWMVAFCRGTKQARDCFCFVF